MACSVSLNPAGLGYDPGRRRLFAGNTAAGTITAIDAETLRVLGTIPAGLGAGSIAVDAARGRAYCADFMAASVTVFDPATLRPLGQIGEHPAVGRPLPEFALPDLRTGRLRRSREWAEKKYILNFFASW